MKSHKAGWTQLCDRGFKQVGVLDGVLVVYAEFLSWPQVNAIAKSTGFSLKHVLDVSENVMSAAFGGNQRLGGFGVADPGVYNGCASAVISADVATDAQQLCLRVDGLEAEHAKALAGFCTSIEELFSQRPFLLELLTGEFGLPSDTPASVAHAALSGAAGAFGGLPFGISYTQRG